MSHSSFKLIANDEPMSQNLIIVVNKNGNVGSGVDTTTLQSLLTSKDTPKTGVTVLRETSPTPSINEEIDSEHLEQFEALKQQYLDEHPHASEEDVEDFLKTIASETSHIPHVTLTVENFYPPDQARKFANDVLHLGGIDNPQTLVPIDFNFRRKIIENDHCYTPLTQSPEPKVKLNAKKKNPVSSVKAAKKEVKPTVKARQSTSMVEDDFDEEQSGEEEVDEEQSAEEEEISFSESDDDNDMDFSVNDRFGKKGTKKKRKYRRQKHKNLTFKDFLTNDADLSSMDEEPKKKYGKVASKKIAPSSRPSTSTGSSGSKFGAASTSKVNPNAGVKKAQPLVIEKASPKIIPQKFVPSPSATFKAATTTATGNISHISIQSAAPTKSIQEMEIVESIAKDLEKSFPESNATTSIASTTIPLKKHIPNIMQIMETNTSPEVLDQSLSSLEHIDTADGGASIEEIGDALIAVLGNEAIDELLNQNDLMNFEQTGTIISKLPLETAPVQVQTVPILADVVTSPIVSPPKILNKQAPQKDPIKIVKNGRVITLPVIEAPATRGAKRRAQGEPLTPIASPSSKAIKVEKTPSTKDPDSRNSSRRSSLNKSESRRQSIATQIANEEDDEEQSAENSEDDPDRLWCICKQPHNNRFMICCDKCEDWFHGTCVNVTKAQGKVMEESKKKWLCPNCKTGSVAKKDPNKKPLNQQKLTKFFSKNLKESTDEDVPKANLCVVCGENPTRLDSIYCSDVCIQSHATKHTDDPSTPLPQQQSPQKPEVKRGNILKSQEGNVIVYDKTTEKLLSSKLWPHISVLQQWLQKNPHCEPVRPGTNKANILMTSISSKKQLSTALQTPTISSTTPPNPKQQSVDELFSNPVKINTGNQPATPSPTVVVKKLNRSQSIKSPTTPKSSAHSPSNVKSVKSNTSISSTSSSSSSAAMSIPNKAKGDEKKLKRQFSDEKIHPSPPTSTKAKIEQERLNVRNNFKTTLETRMKNFDYSPKMSSEEIDKFAKQLELEMFLFFNKDTKEKYKNKFRSLKFNLSDVKNKTLMEKICKKALTPKQLATLTPAELASEELAKWREDENKHQLEIITKSELDALAINKIVVKTHKGEEIIETNPTPTEILIPGEEDIESAIAKTVLSIDDNHGRHDKSPLSSPSISSSSHHHHHSQHKSSSSSSKHKRRSRSRSRGRDHHSRSHGSSTRDKSRNRSKHRDEKHHRDKSKSNDTDSKSSAKSHSDAKKSSHHHHHSHHSHHHEVKDKEKPKEPPKEKKPREIQPEQEDVDLVGKILDSMGVHLDMQPVTEKTEEIAQTPPAEKITTIEPVNEHRLEIEIYSGSMYMADIAKFDVTASIVSGNVDDVMKNFPSTMEVVGRIEPKTVWDYLGKIKKLPGKELVVLRFKSTNESAYFSLFSYLHTRQRYGVIKCKCATVKDFYLIPVEANRPLPQILLPIDGPGFIEGEEHKPDLLLGVILRNIPESKQMKKPSKESTKKSVKHSRPPVEHIVPIEIIPAPRQKSHHHHHSSSKLVMGLPDINDGLKESSPSPSDDEPYEPMDEDDSDLLKPSTSSSKLNTSDDYESQMEIINRQIEQRQMEIQQLAQQKAMELDEAQATRIFEKISVPHNLSEILSTIKASSESKPMDIDDDDDLEYVPAASSTQSNAEYRASTSYSSAINPTIVNSMMDIDERINLFRAQEMTPPAPQQSRLASMSDADLLKLVPDNAFEMAVPPAPIISKEPAIPGLEYMDN